MIAAPLPSIPDGVAFFLDSRDMIRDPDETARLLLEAGATHVYVLTSSVDGRMQPSDRVARVTGACHAKNIRVIFYFFPVDKSVTAHELHLDECVKKTGVIDVCADIEPIRFKDDVRTQVDESELHDWDAQEISSLFTRLRSKGYRLSISVFPRKVWKSLDWKEVLGSDVEVLLQLYTTIAGPETALAKELAFWKAQGIRTIICVGSYVGNAARYGNDLRTAERHSSVARVVTWVLSATDKAERAASLAFVVDAWPAP
jgi:hypothetical protein